ncbi:G-D-S-L family lipolytic protein [Fructilactobacillus fructivorans]|uniref:SGNH/GDSL hydrolase family protein n=1 Tax=Fructilactobacillus fructivorans TaxID=1614 RepID=UPI000705346D|nr:SGNH/GDSL hydrolase family protein [Fructilactobacillus fructivorans]KRN12431.1 G-D-S-L family lipolytic protein [Fructilactobacillus fructivorans]
MKPINEDNIILLGDSLTRGFDGEKDLVYNWPYYLGQFLPFKSITNAGQNAGTITGNCELDLTYQIDHHNFKNYELATIFYGTNDFAHRYETLEVVGRMLDQNIKQIKAENPSIMILGILPLNRFDGGSDNYNMEGLAHYTFGQLLNCLIKVYHQNDINVLNWRKVAPTLVDNSNYQTRLNDHRLHPNSSTYKIMARIIAEFIQKNVNQKEP